MSAGSLIVIAVIAGAVALAILSLVRDRRRGKCNCGCDCGCCSKCDDRPIEYTKSHYRGDAYGFVARLDTGDLR